jgi:chorismate dehydratase
MIGRTSTQFTFAAVPYANAAPLAHFLPQVHADVAVIFAPPSQLAQAVIDGRADAALVPVVDCFANPELRIIDGMGICADGDVQSVLLKCERPLESIRTVSADPASRTSNALARVLLADHFGLSVEIRPFDPDESPDAAVVIGDRALQAPPAPGGDIDLAGQWKLMTSLPFVFAVWAHRADHPDPQGLAETARAARDAGVAAIDELASIWAERLGLNFQRCRDYLGSAIHYDLGPRERAGMQLFKELLAGRQAATSSVSGREGSGG